MKNLTLGQTKIFAAANHKAGDLVKSVGFKYVVIYVSEDKEYLVVYPVDDIRYMDPNSLNKLEMNYVKKFSGKNVSKAKLKALQEMAKKYYKGTRTADYYNMGI